MVSLVDLAPSTKSVSVGGASVQVLGVSAKGLAALLQQFPELANVFTGGAAEIDVPTILKFGPDIVAAIIAAGCGSPGDFDAITVAGNLPIGDQVNLLSAIVELTMPQGVGPFVDALTAAMGNLNLDGPTKAPVGKSESPLKV